MSIGDESDAELIGRTGRRTRLRGSAGTAPPLLAGELRVVQHERERDEDEEYAEAGDDDRNGGVRALALDRGTLVDGGQLHPLLGRQARGVLFGDHMALEHGIRGSGDLLGPRRVSRDAYDVEDREREPPGELLVAAGLRRTTHCRQGLLLRELADDRLDRRLHLGAADEVRVDHGGRREVLLHRRRRTLLDRLAGDLGLEQRLVVASDEHGRRCRIRARGSRDDRAVAHRVPGEERRDDGEHESNEQQPLVRPEDLQVLGDIHWVTVLPGSSVNAKSVWEASSPQMGRAGETGHGAMLGPAC